MEGRCHMAWSAFDDKAEQPTDRGVAAVLGVRVNANWDRLKASIAKTYAPLIETWKFSGKAYGWSLQLKQKKRAVVYMTPCRGFFRAAFAFGEKAANAAHEAGLPAAALKIIHDAPKYAEGRAVRIEVRTKKDVTLVEKLAAIKMAN